MRMGPIVCELEGPGPDRLLDCVERALHALSRGCHAGANALIPPGDSQESISWRYARAAASWPGGHVGAGPSHERQAELIEAEAVERAHHVGDDGLQRVALILTRGRHA